MNIAVKRMREAGSLSSEDDITRFENNYGIG